MPTMNAKNAALNPAASTDLGLNITGNQDIINEQERMRRLKQAKMATPSLFGDEVLGGVAQDIFGRMK
jgi:hypothetical protein